MFTKVVEFVTVEYFAVNYSIINKLVHSNFIPQSTRLKTITVKPFNLAAL